MSGLLRSVIPAALVALLILACAGARPYRIPAGPSAGFDRRLVRVLVYSGTADVRVFSASRMTMRDLISGAVVLVTHGNPLTITLSSLKRPVLIESSDAPIFVNDSQYRGYIEVRAADGKVLVINTVSVRDYLLGVVPGEIPASWEPAALQAQAIAARSFLYYRLANPPSRVPAWYDVDSTTRFQVYKGLGVEQPSTVDAVLDTDSQVLLWEGRPAITYFHSTCGGHTAEANDVWSGPGQSYLASVRCRYCGDSTRFRWRAQLKFDEIEAALRKSHGTAVKITGVSFKRHGERVVSVTIRHRRGELQLSGNNFRLLIPGDALKSLVFASRREGRVVHLEGRGWGHGVGLCQWGARGMAKRGYSAKEILRFYYRGVDIRGVHGIPVARKSGPVNAQ